MDRKEELRKKFSERRSAYITNLSGKRLEELQTDDEKRLAYLEGFQVYEKLKEEGKIPAYCTVLDNLHILTHKKSPILTGNAVEDPVFNFLLEVRKQVEYIAAIQYAEKRGPEPRGLAATGMKADDYEMDLETVVSTKREFVDSLLSLMAKRGFDRSIKTCDWYQDVALNEKRYHWLSMMNNSVGNRSAVIERLVERFPSYGWERFHWVDS